MARCSAGLWRGGASSTLLSDGRLDFAPLLRGNLQFIAEHSGIEA